MTTTTDEPTTDLATSAAIADDARDLVIRKADPRLALRWDDDNDFDEEDE